jgi:hypothetical protein
MTPEQTRARQTENQQRWRTENPERNRENWQRHQATPEAQAKQQERDKRRHPMRRMRTYGLTPERFMQIFEEQKGCCYLCSEPLDLEAKRGMHIDHDHSCCRGASSCGDCVRGFACMLCNNGIGAFGDDPDRMERAAARLRAASAAVAARKAARPVQPDLFPNVVPIERREAAG